MDERQAQKYEQSLIEIVDSQMNSCKCPNGCDNLAEDICFECWSNCRDFNPRDIGERMVQNE